MGYLSLLQAVRRHARAHGATWEPTIGVVYPVLFGPPAYDVQAIRKAGFKLITATPSDPEQLRRLIRMRVDGIATDRPDVLRRVLQEEAAADGGRDKAYYRSFDVLGHRGARGLRPENTLPAFEAGLDSLATTLELDIGVTRDGRPLIWHDQVIPASACRRSDGSPYLATQQVRIKDVSMAEAQKAFVCDKLRFGGVQTNDLSLSPVAVAFAAKEMMPNPYAPTSLDQLFRFVAFYADYYRSGPGTRLPAAEERRANAERVRFLIETKLTPLARNSPARPANAPVDPASLGTADPATFVETIDMAVRAAGMEGRATLQSFDYRTLVLMQERDPKLPTLYWAQGSGEVGYRPSEIGGR